MEQMILKAVTTATDEGVFTAVISTASVDREKDVVSPAGMVRALQKWAGTGKKLPLAWNHSTAPEEQVGFIDPASAKQVGNEVVAQGFIDQSTQVGEHVWRLVKSGTLGFSFGYLILAGTKRKGGGRNIDELDVFEVTATTTPMNNDTRVLGWKASMSSMSPADLLAGMADMAQAYIDNAPDPEDADEMRGILDDIQELVADVDDAADQAEDASETGKALRRRADDLALEHASGGMSRQKRKKAEPEPELVPAGADWIIPETELMGAKAGELKAVWTTAYVNSLPDSSFLYIEPGGSKDDEGKTTPRSLRHFPVKDAGGAVDMPHLRNALARIPQSNLSQSVKDEATAKAQRMMDANKSVDVTDRAPRGRSVDPLRAKAQAVELEFASGGESLKKPPVRKDAPKPTPELQLDDLRRRMREQTLIALSGVEDI